MKEDAEICSHRKELYRIFSDKCRYKMQDTARKKNRTLEPWNHFNYKDLLKRLNEEYIELKEAIDGGIEDEIIDECYDVANFAIFIHELAVRRKLEKSNTLS